MTRRGCLIILAIFMVSVLGLIFAGNFYTAERMWVAGVTLGDPIHAHPPLNVALKECVAAHDPEALGILVKTGNYKTSGWFLPEA